MTAPLTIRGFITGRSKRNGPIDALGNPVAHSHDRDVRLSVTIYPPGAPASVFVIGLESLKRGTLEIGDEVEVTVSPKQLTPLADDIPEIERARELAPDASEIV